MFNMNKITTLDTFDHIKIPSPTLLKDVRAELVRRGTSLKAFCEAHGFVRQHVGQVVSGKRKGPKATELVDAFLAKVDETKWVS